MRRHRPSYVYLVLLLVVIMTSSCSDPSASGIAGTSLAPTQISKWPDGKDAVYLLSFDDQAPTQLVNVVPELNRRMLTGTFYVVPGNELWAATRDQWVEASRSPYVALANHTFTHEGVISADDLDQELERSNDVLYQIYADRRAPFLLSFGKPGGVPWDVTADQQAAALKRHNLIERPPFRGSPTNYSSQEQLVASVDDAIAQGGVGYNDMHGVGGDWLSTPVEWFVALLDKLDAEKERLWIPDVASYGKYTTEREASEAKVVSADANEIRVSLATSLDVGLYDYPLTLTTQVPVGWTRAKVIQRGITTLVPVLNRRVMYGALPGAGEVRIVPE